MDPFNCSNKFKECDDITNVFFFILNSMNISETCVYLSNMLNTIKFQALTETNTNALLNFPNKGKRTKIKQFLKIAYLRQHSVLFWSSSK